MARPTGASSKLLARLMQPACKRGTCHLRQPGSKGGGGTKTEGAINDIPIEAP
jgi:hypothetical protein